MAPDLDETFDVLIKYGDEETYDVFRNGYERVGTTIFQETAPAGISSTHGMLGSNAVDGYYVSYCAGVGGCGSYGNDFANFSTNANFPGGSSVPCGYHYSATWKSCPAGDDVPRMRLFIRP